MKRATCLLLTVAALLTAPARRLNAQSAAATSQLTDAEQEEFLRTAKIVRTKSASKGVTGTSRVTMTDGKLTHDAHVQCIDEAKQEFVSDRGTELNFKDSYKFNIAAYRLS